MRHVDEGALHAYLDGALDALPRPEAEWIRAHLDECEACRGRLEQARSVRREADAILAGASPPVVDAPSLEELRARARETGRGGSGGWGGGAGARLRRLSWAASVVVALGAGWLARDLTAPGAPAYLLAPLPRGVGDVLDAANGPALPPPERAQDAEAVSDEGGAGPTVDPLPELSAEAGSGTAGAAAAAREGEPDLRRSAEVQGAAVPAPSPSEDMRRLRSADPETEALAGPRLRSAVPAEEEEMAGGLSHPGLAVMSVGWVEPRRPELGVEVRQSLPGGGVLRVIHLRDPAEPSLLPAALEGEAEWSGPRVGGWLVLRGPVDQEALAAWAAGIPGARR